MNISIIGSGYVGLVTGACLASEGMNVLCCDNDYKKIENLKKGVYPIYEPYLDSLLDNCAIKLKRVRFTTDIKHAANFADVIFITVNTPVLDNGICDTSRVLEVARALASHMDGYKIIVTKSTVPVGTGREIRNEIRKILNEREKDSGCSINFDVVSNPEFLREGSAIEDFFNPDRIVIGAESEHAANTLKEIYREQADANIPILVTDIETAEMIKYASNAFLATKVSFINEIANICEKFNVNVDKVAKGIGLDRRIGRWFLNPGPGFGGSCFPKDVKALAGLGRSLGYEPLLLESVLEVNNRQKNRMVEKIKNALGGLEGHRISVLGLSFKPETDDIRESPSLTILSALLESKARISVYDPRAMENVKKTCPQMDLDYCSDPYSACAGSDCIVLATEWKELVNLDFERLKPMVNNRVFIDLRNAYNPDLVKSHGFYYEGVGIK
ncbi:MAG: UDP-glucose dehydrogenase family protein [Acetivibrionales bacterium]|jgi:UDPglucose 6-dehydrogenase